MLQFGMLPKITTGILAIMYEIILIIGGIFILLNLLYYLVRTVFNPGIKKVVVE